MTAVPLMTARRFHVEVIGSSPHHLLLAFVAPLASRLHEMVVQVDSLRIRQPAQVVELKAYGCGLLLEPSAHMRCNEVVAGLGVATRPRVLDEFNADLFERNAQGLCGPACPAAIGMAGVRAPVVMISPAPGGGLCGSRSANPARWRSS